MSDEPTPKQIVTGFIELCQAIKKANDPPLETRDVNLPTPEELEDIYSVRPTE